MYRYCPRGSISHLSSCGLTTGSSKILKLLVFVYYFYGPRGSDTVCSTGPRNNAFQYHKVVVATS